jgi:HlyD family secretion protein
MTGRRTLVAAAAALGTLAVAFTPGESRSQPGGTVTLTATGTVQAPQQVALDFASPGRLVALDVRPGETVAAGELLARLDPGSAESAVETARANLASSRAQLLQLRQGLTAAGRAQLRVGTRQAVESLAAALQALRDARAAAHQDAIRLETAVAQTAGELAADRATLAADQGRLAADQAPLTGDQAAANAAAAQVATDQGELAADQATLLADQKRQADDQAAPAGTAAAATATLAADAKAILDDQAAAGADQARLADDTGALADARNAVTADVGRVSGDRQALAADQGQVTADADALANARDAEAAGAVAEAQSLHTAGNAVTAARLGVGASRASAAVQLAAPRVGTLVAARAAVRLAEASLSTAEEQLRETRLVAPFAGTVAAVAAVPGALVPTQGGAGLITLVDLGRLTITASFGAAEAALLTPGEQARITVSALADQALPARVLAVDPLPDPGAGGTAPQAAATYTATLALGDPPATLRPGMQVEVDVATTLPGR